MKRQCMWHSMWDETLSDIRQRNSSAQFSCGFHSFIPYRCMNKHVPARSEHTKTCSELYLSISKPVLLTQSCGSSEPFSNKKHCFNTIIHIILCHYVFRSELSIWLIVLHMANKYYVLNNNYFGWLFLGTVHLERATSHQKFPPHSAECQPTPSVAGALGVWIWASK